MGCMRWAVNCSRLSSSSRSLSQYFQSASADHRYACRHGRGAHGSGASQSGLPAPPQGDSLQFECSFDESGSYSSPGSEWDYLRIDSVGVVPGGQENTDAAFTADGENLSKVGAAISKVGVAINAVWAWQSAQCRRAISASGRGHQCCVGGHHEYAIYRTRSNYSNVLTANFIPL